MKNAILYPIAVFVVIAVLFSVASAPHQTGIVLADRPLIESVESVSPSQASEPEASADNDEPAPTESEPTADEPTGPGYRPGNDTAGCNCVGCLTEADVRRIASTDDVSARLQRLESRVLDEAAVRKVAEEVYRSLNVAIRTPAGDQRVQPVKASSQSVHGFELKPGEQLVGYTDAATGRWIKLQPQPSRVAGATNLVGDGVAFQQQGSQARVRLVPPASAPSNCRIINGVRVCQ